MIVVKGSVPIAFGGTEQPAAFGELVSIGGLTPDVNKKLSAAIADILETKLSVPKNRFFLKFFDSKATSFSPFCCLLDIYHPHFKFSYCILPACLGQSNSRICTMSTCFTPELDHVNKHLHYLQTNESPKLFSFFQLFLLFSTTYFLLLILLFQMTISS